MLAERWRSELSPRDIAALIENGRFQQVAIELSSDDALEAMSRKVARKKLQLPVQEAGGS